MFLKQYCTALILLVATELIEAQYPCAPRTYKDGYSVCVCNSTYCDSIEPPGQLQKGTGALYYSSKQGARMRKTIVSSQRSAPGQSKFLEIDSSQQFQKIFGFGATFTDASMVNINSLPKEMGANIIKQYYSRESGIGYTFGRVPMGATDFSTKGYTYDDVENDFDLRNFAIPQDEVDNRISHILSAISYTNNTIKLIATPWSPPAWMKTNNNILNYGMINGDININDTYFRTWANYFVRFFDEYQKQNVSFWGFSIQNAPSKTGFTQYNSPTCQYTAEMETDFIAKYVGRIIKNSTNTKDLNLIIFDDNRDKVEDWTDMILGDAFAAKHVAGIGLHWYDDRDFNAFLVNNTHYKWPQYFILSTEARTDWRNGKTHVVLGDWAAGAGYASNVIQDLHTWYSGWIDMNLALDTEGGPSWTKNIADAPIIVNASATEYYKQPMYHAIAHFSKFIQPNATRIAETWMSFDTIGLNAVAFLNPDGTRTVVIHNYDMLQVGVNIVEKTNPGYYYSFEMDPYSIATLTIN